MPRSSLLVLFSLLACVGCGAKSKMVSGKLEEYIKRYGKPILTAEMIKLTDNHLVIVNPTLVDDWPVDVAGKTLLLSRFPVVEQDMRMLMSAPFMSQLSMPYAVEYLEGEVVIVEIGQDGRASDPRSDAVINVAIKVMSAGKQEEFD